MKLGTLNLSFANPLNLENSKMFVLVNTVVLQVNPCPNKPWFLHVCSTSLLKTLLEKEKLLIMSNFSFSQCFLPVLENYLQFSSNLKLLSANSLNFEESQICYLKKGYICHLQIL